MSRTTYLARAALGLVLGLTLGCSGERPDAPVAPDGGGGALARAEPRAVLVQRQQLARLTRRVARALADPEVRAQVYQAIRTSPYREHKLHFRTFLRGSGRRLVGGMAALESGLTQAALVAGLDSITDLEFYLPVAAHRDRWTGDARLLVASALQDHETPVAFDLGGRPVRLSAEAPPDIPTLALVPVETDFTRVPGRAEICPDCGGGGGDGGGGDPPDGDGVVVAHIAMTWSYVPGRYEGWLMGNPEFEIHAFGHRSVSDTTVADLQCAGEHAASAPGQPGVASSAYVYDQNSAYWSGQVRLLSAEQIQRAQASPDSGIVFWLWEDDNTACVIKKNSTDATSYMVRLASVLTAHRNAIRPIIKRDWSELRPDSLIRTIIDLLQALQNDDIVGVFVDQAEVGLAFSDATHAIVNVRDDGTREVRGRVRLALVQ